MSPYLRVLRHRDFRFLFLGQSASAVGDQVVFVALALYVTERTGSATATPRAIKPITAKSKSMRLNCFSICVTTGNRAFDVGIMTGSEVKARNYWT